MNWRILASLLIAIILLASAFLLLKNHNNPASQLVPTLQPSPTMNYQASGWQTFNDPSQHVIFHYPKDLSTTYIRLQEWPPMMTVSNDSFSCHEGDTPPTTTVQKTIHGNHYCVKSMSE